MARKIIISGRLTALDEEWFSPNVVESSRFNWSSILSEEDDNLMDDYFQEVRTGGEVRGELSVEAQLRSNQRVKIIVDLNLFEGTSESTSDLDGSRSFSFFISPNHTVERVVKLYNESEGAGDYVKVRMVCKNEKA